MKAPNVFPSNRPVNPDSLWGKVWVPYIKPNLNFDTQKTVRLSDWRLGLTLRSFQFIIITYILIDVLYNKKYVAREQPLGILDSLVEDDGGFSKARAKLYQDTLNQSIKTICNTPENYNFEYSEYWNYTYDGCLWPSVNEVSRKVLDSTFFPTEAQVKEHIRVPAEDPYESIAANKDLLCENQFKKDRNNEDSKFRQDSETCITSGWEISWTEGPGNGICMCSSTKHYLYAAVENVSIVVDHSFYTSSQSYSQPQTFLRRKGDTEILKSWEPGEEIRAHMWEFLAWGGVDLDKRMDEEPNRQFVEAANTLNTTALQGSVGRPRGLYPRLRTSGLELTVTMSYYNHGLESTIGVTKDPMQDKLSDTVCIMEISPNIQWTSQGAQVSRNNDLTTITYAQGIEITFNVRGEVGSVQWLLLLTSFVNGMVLLNLANIIVTVLASYGMGLKSPFFVSSLREHCDFSEEYARYAAHLVSAAKIFDLLDGGDEQLDKYELYKMVRQVVLQMPGDTGEKMTPDDTMALVGFLLHESDKGRTKKKKDEEHGGEPEKTLDNPEWVAAFTGRHCDLETFQGYIKRKQRLGFFPPVSKEELQKLEVFDRDFEHQLKQGGKLSSHSWRSNSAASDPPIPAPLQVQAMPPGAEKPKTKKTVKAKRVKPEGSPSPEKPPSSPDISGNKKKGLPPL